MNAGKMTHGVYSLSAVDWNRRLFDSLIPLPDGTGYNAYLVEGKEKTALLDTVEPTQAGMLMSQLDNVARIDYIIAQHAEPDHSGPIPLVLEKYPQTRVLTSEKAQAMLTDLLPIRPEQITTVGDGEKLDLGGKTLEFIYTPWVHWPETMSTYLAEDSILFTCDFFGSHYATSEIGVDDDPAVYEAAKRYYAEIMMPFRKVIRKNLDKIGGRKIAMIAPGHGPVYRHPEYILAAYRDWISDEVKNEVVIPYVSMHGSTARMIEFLTDELAARQIRVRLFDLAATDLGKLAIAMVDAATLIIGTPTVNVGPHPLVFAAANLANMLRPKLRYVSIVNSYGWSSKAVERLQEAIPDLKVEMLSPVICRGVPGTDAFTALARLAEEIKIRHHSL